MKDKSLTRRVIVIGGGPAGIMAAVAASDQGAEVELWERNRVLGRKLAITGKGRCNITNNCEPAELIRNILGHGSFLYSAFARFDADDTMAFFTQRCGLPLKTERGRRVFPASDSAHDVVNCLKELLKKNRVLVCCEQRAKRLALRDGAVFGVYDYNGTLRTADAVIVATGGMTYPATGSTGDGYALAQQAGHTVTSLRPSLVPLETKESWPAEVSGLSLKNVEVSIWQKDTLLDKDFGEMLFTHFGVSGPIVLSLSRTTCAHPQQGNGLELHIDLKPAISAEQLDERLQRNTQKFIRKQFANSLNELLPASLIPVFVRLSNIEADKPVNQLTKAERQRMVELLKSLPLTIRGPRPLAEAIVTAGGIEVKEVDPKSMESRLTSGLFFAGEVLDIDGYTGGYNLQAAWSSGYIAGISAAQ